MLMCLCFKEEFEENLSFHFRHHFHVQVALKQVQHLVNLNVSRAMVDYLELVPFWKLHQIYEVKLDLVAGSVLFLAEMLASFFMH